MILSQLVENELLKLWITLVCHVNIWSYQIKRLVAESYEIEESRSTLQIL